MGLIALLLLCLLPEPEVTSAPQQVQKTEEAPATLVRSAVDFNWRTSREPYALCVLKPDGGAMPTPVLQELKQLGFKVLVGPASEFPIDARAKLSKNIDIVLMNHDGLHVKALGSLEMNEGTRTMLKEYSLDNTRRRNERLILRIRHNLQVLGMLDTSQGAVNRALGELSDISKGEQLPALDKLVEKVYLERQRVIMDIRATSTSQPGLRSVRVPSQTSGSASIEIPEVTMQSLRTTVSVTVR
ncbi:MAG: hypothetical protein AB7F75_03965 [Planctomycetota bacterium]